MLMMAGRKRRAPECWSSNGPGVVRQGRIGGVRTLLSPAPRNREGSVGQRKKHGVAKRRAQILLRGMARMYYGVVIHGVFILVDGQFQGPARFFGSGGERNGSEQVLGNRRDRRCFFAGTRHGLFDASCGSLHPCAGCKERRENQKKEAGREAIHQTNSRWTHGSRLISKMNLAWHGKWGNWPKGQVCTMMNRRLQRENRGWRRTVGHSVRNGHLPGNATGEHTSVNLPESDSGE
jgi:hypothetical protein